MIDAALIEDGAVLRIGLRSKILTGAVLSAIRAELEVHRDDHHLRLVLIRGSGGHFSFGASVEEHRRDQAARMLACFHDTVRTVASYPVPIACVVEGKCLGGAFELALASHFVFATVSAIFACPEIKLGVIPPVLAAIGPHRMPPAVAERMILTGEEIDASTAATFGFVTKVVAGDPEAATLAWYRNHLKPLSAFALRQAAAASRLPLLAALDRTLDLIEEDYLQKIVPSHDGNEGIEAFLAKREPVWTDA